MQHFIVRIFLAFSANLAKFGKNTHPILLNVKSWCLEYQWVTGSKNTNAFNQHAESVNQSTKPGV